MNIEEKIIEIIKDIVENDNEPEININTTNESIEGWDSLSHLQIIIGIESAFDIKLKTSEINQLKSIEALVEKVSELVNA